LNSLPLWFGLAFMIVGIAFKFGAVPFHMWLPDVYEGARTPVTLYIASAPKLAALALTMRILVDGFAGLHDTWQGMIMVVAVLSLVIGNVVAIAQTNIKCGIFCRTVLRAYLRGHGERRVWHCNLTQPQGI
jgi:NADH-quinone oxidoreductase subunit N